MNRRKAIHFGIIIIAGLFVLGIVATLFLKLYPEANPFSENAASIEETRTMIRESGDFSLGGLSVRPFKEDQVDFIQVAVPGDWQANYYDNDSASLAFYAPNSDAVGRPFLSISSRWIRPQYYCYVQGCPPEDPNKYVQEEREKYGEELAKNIQERDCVLRGKVSFVAETKERDGDYYDCQDETLIAISAKEIPMGDADETLYVIRLKPDLLGIPQQELIQTFLKNAHIE